MIECNWSIQLVCSIVSVLTIDQSPNEYRNPDDRADVASLQVVSFKASV